MSNKQKQASDRFCPFCCYINDTGHGVIHAVLNEIREDKTYEARCICPNCHAIWDEYHNPLSGSLKNYIVGFEELT